jgi:hypothetical protein
MSKAVTVTVTSSLNYSMESLHESLKRGPKLLNFEKICNPRLLSKSCFFKHSPCRNVILGVFFHFKYYKIGFGRLLCLQ